MAARREARPASAFTKFRLLMWKNFLQQWRHRKQTFIEFLLPVLTMALVLLLRWQIEPSTVQIRTYPPIPAHSLNYSTTVLAGMNLTQMSIAYSPTSPVLEDVVRTAVISLFTQNARDLIPIIIDSILENNGTLPGFNGTIPGFNGTIPGFPESIPGFPDWIPGFPDLELPPDIDLNSTIIEEIIRSMIRVDAYNSSEDLTGLYVLEKTTRKVIAAVEFDDKLLGATQLSNNLSYSLRFPMKPRLNSFYSRGGRTWRTHAVFPLFELPGPRFPFSWEGGNDPGYVNEMFIALQHVISTELISRATQRPELKSYKVNIQRYPHPAYVEDLAVEALQLLFPMFLMLSFSYTAVNIVRAVTMEKELQLKETMKIMGLPTWLHWTAWFCKQFFFLFITAVFIVVLLKVNWFTNEHGFNEYAVFTNTPWTVLFFYILLYLTCVIFFCFMISGFFSKGSTAALFTGVLWFMSYIPAALLSMDVNMSTAVQIFTCLSINSAMSYGFQLMLARESIGGLQWGDFMATPTTDSTRFVFGHVVIMLAVDCVIYMLITLYLEQVLPGPFGTPKPWNFLFQKSFWCSNATNHRIVVNLDDGDDLVKEKDPTHLPIGVQMENLTKVYGTQTAVNNLSLNIYDSQITVLLGHNGAGKSTTISMLTGNLEVTHGSVSIAGYDMFHQTESARAHIGLCPQHNVLFNQLTVKEHLEFFARLKGFSGAELDAEIDSLIEKLELQDKRDYQSQGLSGGQKRRLSVGIALSGAARVVLLDEPTSGMDPASRRALWDLLQKEKHGRSMILTTHFMDEADILGDRVAIMAHGRLQCVGSPYFLKRHYGVGYTLVVVKDDNFQYEACIDLINRYIPGTTIKEDRGTEITFGLINDYSHVFEQLLNDMERNISILKFKNYGLVPTTLEDVFMSVGSDLAPVAADDDAATSTDSLSDDLLKHEVDSSLEQLAKHDGDVTGIRLVWQHMYAVWLKLILVWARSWWLIILQFCVPLFLINSTLGVLQYVMSFAPTMQSRLLALSQGYSNTETLLSFTGNTTSSVGAAAAVAYEMMFSASDVAGKGLTLVGPGWPIDQYYLNRTSDVTLMGSLRHRLLIGSTFEDESATAWFSNFGYHDVANSLTYVHSAMLRAWNTTVEFNVYNHPLEATYNDQSDLQLLLTMLSMQLASGIGSSVGIVSAVFIMFYIKERISGAKLLQKAAGVQPAVLWGSAAVFDWLWFLVISVTIVISCAAFNVIGLSSVQELGRMYLCVMVYGAAMLPLNYTLSHVFKGPALGFVSLFFINVLLGIMGTQIVDALSALPNTREVGEIMDMVLQFYPLYSLVTAVRYLNQIGMREYTCLQGCQYLQAVLPNLECTMQAMCENYSDNCCVRENPYFDWEEPGVLRYLVVMLATCAALWGLLMLIEYRIFQKVFTFRKRPPPLDESTLDEDVAAEIKYVRSADRAGLAQHALIAKGLSKYYGKHLAVDQISFRVNDDECFGLLGVNGAGKTSTFKMLMGDESVSSGHAFVGGHSVRTRLNRVHQNIGYCPQSDALFGELTGRETLRVFSLLRGLRAHAAPARADALAHSLGFYKHLDKRVDQYSGGTKRKLNAAIAFLGRTRLVFVDEPTTGIDPAAKRHVWRAVRGVQRAGRGVVLTSHSMEECEALCSRLTIMVNGRFQCLGTPQHLKNKFSQGFTLTIKLKVDDSLHNASPTPCDNNANMDSIKHYVNSNFHNPRIMEEYQGLLTYYLPERRTAWSRLFGAMERARRELPVEGYSIAQTTLEQIFLQFTKYQTEGR